MQELERRLRIAEISANVQGVNADNFIKFCNTLEGWVAPVSEDDPLRIGMPSPCNGDCGMSYCDENGCTDKKDVIGSPAPMEIDWSRPQLVKVKPDIHGEEVVVTNGIHESIDSDYPHFEGTVISSNGGWEVGRFSKSWRKSAFVYHGEIPEADNQKISASKEPKTTGLNFLEAVAACKSGKNIRRPTWDGGDFLYCSGAILYDESGEEVTSMMVCVHDILATDWQIVKS